MFTRHADRIWMLGGIVAAALLLALGWFLAIEPQNSEASQSRAEQESAQTRLISLRRRLTELEQQKARLPQFEATLRAYRAALPTGSGLPDFLRQLQESGDQVGVSVSGLTVTRPEAGDNPSVYALPITVTADGNGSNLDRFLHQLQQVQPRAVLIQSANVASAGKGSKRMSLTLSLKAFVATAVGVPAPTTTPTK